MKATAAWLTSHQQVSFLPCRAGVPAHELATQRGVAEQLAALMGCSVGDDLDLDAPSTTPRYVVPNETLTSLECARRLGICSEQDLFGGVVPFPFMATKTIAHCLVGGDAAAPAGWCAAFAEGVAEVVLPGHSAFSASDARIAARRLLHEGVVRIKLGSGVGGSGQWVAHDETELDACLATLDPGQLACTGVAIERNLADARTFSIGLLRLGTLLASYFGTQRTTLNRHGKEVYGGSSLIVVRGGWDSLEHAAGRDADVSRAIAVARTFHSAALTHFAGMFASRCNYDVVQGRDAKGQLVTGVLEQSWRIGGASVAEVAALQALLDDPSLESVRAASVEVHEAQASVPAGATVYFSGVDEHVGPITKYAQVRPHARA